MLKKLLVKIGVMKDLSMVVEELRSLDFGSAYKQAFEYVINDNKPSYTTSQEFVSGCLHIIDSLEINNVNLSTRQKQIYDACVGGQFGSSYQQ